MKISTTPLWQEQSPMPPHLGKCDLPARVDVAIVGGGYTGLSAALWLARFGLRVAVLERHGLGWGASSRNGGKALVGLKPEASFLVKRFGEGVGRSLWQASLDGISTIEEVVKEESIDCDFVRCGSLYAAAKPRHYEKMCRETEWLGRAFGYERTNVARTELGSEIGTAAYFGGVVDPLSAGLHPAKYMGGLAAAAHRAGATLCASTDVTGIDGPNGGHRLRTSKGGLQAREVLIATNGYADGLVRSVQRRVVPIGSYIIATEPLAEAVQKTISPKGRMFYDSKWFLNYFRLTPDGRMLFGGRTAIATDQDLTVSAKVLRNAMVRMFPELENVAITHSWAGHLGLTFDALPHIGCIEGLHYALGYSGHGVGMSALLGRHVAEMLAGKRRQSVFSQIKHPTFFFYRGRPWFRPILGATLRLMDRLA